MTQFCSVGTGYNGANSLPNDKQLLLRERNTPQDGSRPAIICLPGHGGDCSQYAPWSTSAVGTPGYHAWSLSEAGRYLILGIDAAATVQPEWGNATAVAAITAAYNYAVGTLGAKSGQVGLMAWSMGGLAALNWIKSNPTLAACAWLWNPCTDLDWANSTAGYTPAYGGSSAGNGSWSTEIAAAYSPYATASNGFRVRDEYPSWRGLGVPIKVCQASDDGTIPPAQSTAFVGGVEDLNVSLRSPAPTGGHVNSFANVPAGEVLAFFQTHL